MKPQDRRDPPETLARIKAAVGPLRFSVCEAAAILATLSAEGADEAEAQERLKAIQAEAGAAREMLQTGARRLLEALDRRLPQDLVAAQEAARAAVAAAVDRLGPLVAAAEDGSLAAADLRPLVALARREVQPRIATFLDALSRHFDDETRKSAADDRDLIRSAMQEIDNISMSINLISLNASVEAARAGEAGRGFAVIAAEIQSLSSESKKAVDSIRQRLA